MALRLWRACMAFVFVLILLRQVFFAKNINSFYSTVIISDIDHQYTSIDGPSRSIASTNATIPSLSSSKIPTESIESSSYSEDNANTNFNISSPQNLFSGEHWMSQVTQSLKTAYRIRLRGKRGSDSRGAVKSNFERLFNRLETIDPEDIDNKRHWHGVTPQNYEETLDAARSSMDEIIEMVDTDCTLWLEPPTEKTAFEIERSDHHHKKSSKDRPILKFQCGNNLMLQDKPCSAANLCLVRSAERQWIQWYRKEASSSSYDHTDLQMKLSPREYANKKSSAPKSAILTMVDSVHYLISGKKLPKRKLGKSYYIWECFLNKAAYALRTNREFYIWIGGLDEESSNDATPNSTTTKLSGSPSIPILHQRNTRTISRTFGAKCNPEIPHKNVVHYYKPIAFGALFRKLREKQQQNDVQQQHQNITAWFVDADIFFNHEAFPQVLGYNSSIINDVDDNSPPSSLSIDDYFEISPQAAMLGSQNPSDKDDNILMNGGLIGLQGSATNPSNLLDDWVMNLSALWWYCRCGERDQIALWLLLFATWSAESPEGSNKFRYPGVIFENYLFSWHAVIPHARESLPLLQTSWSDNKDLWSTAPANPNKPLDGGKGFVERGTFTAPLELPHVLLLPLDPFVVNATSNHRSHFDLGIARKNQHEKKALLSHTKNVFDVCYDFKCWPYLIRKDPKAGHPSSNEGNDEEEEENGSIETNDEEEEENESTEMNNDEEESDNSNTEDGSVDNTSVENSNTSEEDEMVPEIMNHQ